MRIILKLLALVTALLGAFLILYPLFVSVGGAESVGAGFYLFSALLGCGFGIPCLLFAWNIWFGGRRETIVFWLSIILAVLFCLGLFELINLTRFNHIEHWLEPSMLWGFGLYLGLGWSLAVFLVPIYLAALLRRRLYHFLLHRIDWD